MGRSSGKFNGKLFARWSLIIVVNLVLLLVVGISTIRETYNDWKVDREIVDLRNQIEGLNGKKMKISELLQKLDSPETLDKEARIRLGMQKPGEKVVILHGATTEPEVTAEQVATIDENSNLSNPQKWIKYFFKR